MYRPRTVVLSVAVHARAILTPFYSHYMCIINICPRLFWLDCATAITTNTLALVRLIEMFSVWPHCTFAATLCNMCIWRPLPLSFIFFIGGRSNVQFRKIVAECKGDDGCGQYVCVCVEFNLQLQLYGLRKRWKLIEFNWTVGTD